MNKILKCNFCGTEKGSSENVLFVPGLEGVCICNVCAKQVLQITEETLKNKKSFRSINKTASTPRKILEFLNDYVIKQDHAKMVLATAIYNHYKMLEYKEQSGDAPVELEKSNIMLVGPTGTGKTLLCKTIAKILDVPFAMGDATSMTEAGFVGSDPEIVIRNLIDAANGDVEKAQKGIIFIDELDKISRKGENPSLTKDPGSEGVQQALLKIVEGAIVDVPPKGQRKHPQQECIKVDTSNILFIVGGAFEGIEKIIQKRLLKSDESSMGFGAKVNSKKDKLYNECILDVKTEDLKKYGIIPELLGRLPIIAPLQELDKEAIKRILIEPKNALLKQYQELFKMDDIELEFDEEALDAVVEKAIEKRTGARSLRGIMEEVLLRHMFNLPDLKEIEKMIITKDVVVNKSEPILIEKLEAAAN